MGVETQVDKIGEGLMHHLDDEVRLHALEATLLVFNSVFWALVLWGVFREPGYGLLWLLGPLLSTVGGLAEKTRVERASAIALNLLMFGFYQFVFASLMPYYILLILAMPLALYISSWRHSGNSAGAVMVAGLMNFEKGSFQVGLDNFCFLAVLAMVVAPTYLLLDYLLIGKNQWSGAPSTPRLSLDAVLRRAAAFMLAWSLDNALEWEFSYWIPLTVALSYSGGNTGSSAQRIARLRMLWAPFGFYLAAAFLSTLSYVDYQFNYLSLLIAFIAFYYCFRADDYIGFFLLFTVMISGLNNLSFGASGAYGSGWNLIGQSTISVAMGGLIVMFCEWGTARKSPALPQKNS